MNRETQSMAQQDIEMVEAVEPICPHRWSIESPNGPTSYGKCKYCGEVREFKNSIKITSWESEGSHVNRNPR